MIMIGPEGELSRGGKSGRQTQEGHIGGEDKIPKDSHSHFNLRRLRHHVYRDIDIYGLPLQPQLIVRRTDVELDIDLAV